MVELEQDYEFAQLLDLCCHNCRSGYSGNESQLEKLKLRGKLRPKEVEIISNLAEKCAKCLEQGKTIGKAIADTHSCLYRGGISGQKDFS